MASTATMPPPLHHLDSQPDNLLAASDVANSSYVPPRVLSEVLDQATVKPLKQPEDKTMTMNGTNGFHSTDDGDIVPPLQPESKPVTDNKAVPWYDLDFAIEQISDSILRLWCR